MGDDAPPYEYGHTEESAREQGIRERLRERIAALEAERDALEAAIGSAFMRLPIVPGTALAFDGRNLDPHVIAVADEWAIRERQLEAERATVEALADALEQYADDECEYVDWSLTGWNSPGCEEGCRDCRRRAALARAGRGAR